MSMAARGEAGEQLQLWDQVWDRVFLLGLLGAVLFVLWLPVFPTGDGPVHLYYADVLWSLVRHQPTYAHDYAVRHLFAPYLVHYLALVAFEHFVAPPMAEKLFIAIIFVVTAFGFRFLARSLGGNALIACVWMLPLLFSWSLGGGFLNCCFATGVALWSFGLWTLLAGAGGPLIVALLVGYAVSLSVLVLSHPVPLLVLLLFTASDLLLQVVMRPAGFAWRARLPQCAALAMTCVAFVAPVLLAQKGQAAAVLPAIGFHGDVLRELASGTRLGLFAGLSVHTPMGWLALVARAGLLLIVPGVVLLLTSKNKTPYAGSTSPACLVDPSAAQGAPSLIKGRVNVSWAQSFGRGSEEGGHFLATLPWLQDPARRLLLITVIFLATTIFFPRSLNNSYFFPQRLWDICWLLVLACGAAATPSPRARNRLGWSGAALVALTAITGLPALARIARAQQQLAAAPLPAGERGLFLEPDSAIDGHGAATTYPLYSWAGARAFATSHAILLNSPWLGLTILPIRDATPAPTHAALLDQGLPSIYSESPLALTHTLQTPSRDRATILARADFLLYSNPAVIGAPQAADDTRRDALALLGPDGAAWHCEAPGFYAVCLHTR